MRRVLCVWLPTLSTDLVKRRRPAPGASDDQARPREQAVILTRPVASRERVARRCVLAAAAGITEGMDLAHARSLLSARTTLHVETHRPDRDRAALHALACWALRFSPLVAVDPPDGLLIDFTGAERLHRGEARLIRAVAAGVDRLGWRARVAAASTFGCAWGVARFGRHDLSRVPPGRERDAIENLPIAALRVDEQTVLGLSEIGITRVGHVLILSRASLAARFDPALVRRLLQAFGELEEHIEPVRAAPAARVELLFDGPTDRWESVEAAARHVLEELASELARRERGVRRLDFTLLRPHAAPTNLQISLSRPSRAVKHLWSLVRARLERVDLGGGVEGVTLVAARTARLRHEQCGSLVRGVDDERTAASAWGELVDTLVGRLGADNVVRIEPVESHLPERAFRERPVTEAALRARAAATAGADRPTILFPGPEPADVMALTPDGPILSLGWRGRRWSIVSSSGPERIGPEWWLWEPTRDPQLQAAVAMQRRKKAVSHGAAPPPDRDYFAAQVEGGRWLWIGRHVGTGRWCVHGEWS